MKRVEGKKKILLISHEMTRSGSVVMLLRMAKNILCAGYLVTIWTLRDGPMRTEFARKGFPIRTVDFDKEASIVLQNEISAYDLVIANTIFSAKAARYAKNVTETVLYLHEARNLPELMEKCDIRPNDITDIRHVVCVSEYAKSYIENEYHPTELTVIPNYTEIGYRNRIRHFRKKTRFLLVGTIEKRKGVDIAIEAFRRLSTKLRDCSELHIAGRIPDWSENYAEQLSLDATGIFFHGEIKRKKGIRKLYEMCDVVVIPSRDESCSLVALEAAMQGKAVLLSENVGAKELFSSADVFPNEDSAVLAQKMESYITEPKRAEKIGKANRTACLRYASEERFQNVFLPYVEQLTSGSKGRVLEEGDIPPVSVVVPVYNVAFYLAECMESILSQTLWNLEIICVDDGSTDESQQILDDFQKRDGRLRVIRTENRGYGHAMNIGMDAAHGKYIAIVEPDDYIERTMFERLYHTALYSGADIVKSDFYRFKTMDGNYVQTLFPIARKPSDYGRRVCPKQEKQSFRLEMNTWTGLYRREFLTRHHIRHNETTGASYQDNGFYFMGFAYAKSVYVVNEAFYHYRWDNPDSSVKSTEKVFAANVEYDWIKKCLQKDGLWEDFFDVFWMKRYHTYLFMMRRIAYQYRADFLKRFAAEFREADMAGELNQAVYTPEEWTNIRWIIRDMQEYYNENVKENAEFSVIIPVYNAETFLPDCLDSVLQQTYKKFEIILIDDGSTDGSVRIMERYMATDHRVRVIRQENKGPGIARNAGLQNARGKYILFLDADDYLAPTMLMKTAGRLQEHDAEICVVGANLYDNQTKKTSRCAYSLQMERYPRHRPFEVYDMEYNPLRAFVGWAWDKVYLRSFLLNNDLRFPALRSSEDMYFTYMSLFKARRVTTISEPLVTHRVAVERSVSNSRDASWRDFLQSLSDMRDEMQNMGIYDVRRNWFQNYAVHSILWNLETLREETAIKLWNYLEMEGLRLLDVDEFRQKDAEYENEYREYQRLRKSGVAGISGFREECRKSVNNPEHTEGTNAIPKDVFSSREQYLEYCLQEIWKSKSFRIGRAVTYLPRKIRGW